MEQQVGTSMAAAAPKLPSISLASGYAPSGVFDELVGLDGVVGPHWQPVLAGLDALPHQQRMERIERINARVRETGIAHDLFADPSRTLQPWRLDLVPLVIPAAAWTHIETAVIQRARLLEAMLADVYGPQDTLARGLIPPELIFSDPAYLRACQTVAPGAGRIQFFAADLARGPDGSWRVVDTHVETPAGIGYALANRTVLTHVSGDIFSASKAVRLAPFFQQMQDALAQRIGRPDPTIALLTPGPHHDDFFNHAYLARYLGFLLVEGADLRAENGRVYLKTLDGLHPIDLIVRCVAGASCDALELDPAGFLGPVGLVQAVRQRPDLVVNALGTAIVENRGLGSYLPNLCQQLLGEPLAIWDVTKWWLGDRTVRQTVIRDLDRYFIRHAFEQTARPGRAAAARDPVKLTPAERTALIAEIELDGAALVAEEKTALGTTPSYGEQGLEAKPYAMRVFATAVPGLPGGFAVMPGGLAMTVDPGMSMALTAPDGASRDVWVVSDAVQPVFKSLWRPTIEAANIQRSPRELPSRAADNLFWLGRYTERADWTFRLLRNCLSRIEEDSGPRQNLRLARAVLTNLLERDGAPPVTIPAGLDEPRVVAHLARALMTSTDRAYGLPQTFAHVHRVASLTRDRLSLEAWRTLNSFFVGRRWQASAMPASIGESLDLIDAGLGAVSAFNGLSHENMTRNFGWSFLEMGRRVSRSLNLSQLLLATFQAGQPDEDDSTTLLFLLELADSFITYRSRYRLNPVIAPVLDLLLLDETNPRSLAFQLASLAAHIDTLPQTGKGGSRTEVQRIALAMLNDVRLSDAVRLAEPEANGRRVALIALLDGIVAQAPQLSEAITRRYFSVIEREPRWARARSRQEP
ncbi:MAG: circularly permuted type 2 ATP-grasp protein [Hyphomicrobiaceae bacterium]